MAELIPCIGDMCITCCRYVYLVYTLDLTAESVGQKLQPREKLIHARYTKTLHGLLTIQPLQVSALIV